MYLRISQSSNFYYDLRTALSAMVGTAYFTSEELVLQVSSYCCLPLYELFQASPSRASLDSGVNEYLVGQRWQCVRLVPSAEMAAIAVCSIKGVEMVHE